MLTWNSLLHLLKTTSGLSLAILLGIASPMPGWAMEKDEVVNASNIPVLQAYADLHSQLKDGDLLFMNVGYGMIQSCTTVSERNTPLFAQHEKLMDLVKTKDVEGSDYLALTKKTKLASGEEFVKLGEKGLPEFLERMSERGVNIIPLSSRGDDGKCGTEGTTEVLSRTEKELVYLKYNWKNWNKFLPFQDLNKEIFLHDNNPEHRTYKWRNNVIYSTASIKPGDAPHKSAAIVGVVNILKEAKQLPSTLYLIDRPKTITEIAEDLKNTDLGIPIHLFSYSHPEAFRVPEELKEFYIHRLGEEKFKKYEPEFNEVFSSLKDNTEGTEK